MKSPPPRGIRPTEGAGGAAAYTPAEAASLLDCSESKVRAMLKAGELTETPAARSRARLVVAEDVLAARRDLLIRLGAREQFIEEAAEESTSVDGPASRASQAADTIAALESRLRFLEEKVRLFAVAQSAQLDSLLQDLQNPTAARTIERQP